MGLSAFNRERERLAKLRQSALPEENQQITLPENESALKKQSRKQRQEGNANVRGL